MAKKKKPKEQPTNGAISEPFDLKRIAARINAQYGAMQESAGAMLMHWRRTLEYRQAIGKDLLEARHRVGEQSFSAFLRDDVPSIPRRTAYRWMEIAHAKNLCHVAQLDPADVADRLTVTPEPEEPEEAAAGEESPQEAEEPPPGADAEGAEDGPDGAGDEGPKQEAETESAPEGEGQAGKEEPAEPGGDDGAEAAAPSFPHSDRLYRWLRAVAADMEVIEINMGGITALLAEVDGWDWKAVTGYILPTIAAVRRTLERYQEEIKSRAIHQERA